MSPSTHSLRLVLHGLCLTVGVLVAMVMSQTLSTISEVRQDPLHQATFEACNGEICRTILSER